MADNQTTVRLVQCVIVAGIAMASSVAHAQTDVLRAMGRTVESTLPANAKITRPVVLPRGTLLVFGGDIYAITGTDSCPTTQPHTGCVEMTPGMAKSVYLNPVGTKDRLRGAVSFTGTPDKVSIALNASSYPDGRVRSYQPPLIGGAAPAQTVMGERDRFQKELPDKMTRAIIEGMEIKQ
ncbi:hypothetical protein HLH34_18790 [Gluconacetobacter azotocaptans]|uniref:Uncharacterized protein n=1 Tax=Gluconacetobacter azotocaptans TaxID=142834 RepID=A0A7W4JW21_9PROT|nr:hypothetical protein [Gluconacetobacter azotocaptans]MBB2191981.1 hypothetical protein [Gluconacetobacter azotocaptans]GBQ31937.1 hypothetical protein AA13594_2231 [Gluconacetobacter azotocaptans DSM 13594]